MTSKKESNQRLIVVSNRLPLSISRSADNQWNFKMSSGGLVAAISGLKNKMSFVWVGWPGGEFDSDDQEQLRKNLWEKENSVPVFLSNELSDLYYNGFSNEVLWPLFHYIVDQNPFETKYWEAYKTANRLFAEEIFKLYKEGDLIWVHDYHLMLLPLYLRKKLPQAQIGFFLHIPFPTSEIFRTLPVREDLLRGVLNSDLVGFHTPDYLNHFSSSCVQLLGTQTTPISITWDARNVSIGVFPVGIEPEKFLDGLQTDAIKEEIQKLQKSFGVDAGKKVLLGVDRLDYIKGIPNKLIALEDFFAQHPEWRDKVTMVQIAVPSRTDVPEYQRLTKDVNEISGRINGIYGSLHHVPMIYLNQSINFTQLCALYVVADAMVITSLRDGMNLVCYEYVTAQKARADKGVLILSEFAGASHSLSGSLSINPYDTKGVARSILESLTMDATERNERHQGLFDYVTYQTSARWGESFVTSLASITSNGAEPMKKIEVPGVLDAFRKSKRRLLIFDDDGTLNPLAENYTFTRPSATILASLKKLGTQRNTDILIVSGRNRRVLQSWFGECPVAIAAEHGGFFRFDKNSPWERRTSEDYHEKQVLTEALPICVLYSERTPGSLVEEKELGLAWHFRAANPYFGRWQARDLELHLKPLLSRLGAEVISGTGILNIKPRGVSKGTAVRRFLESVVLNSMLNPPAPVPQDMPPLELVADMKSLDALRQQNLSSSGSSLNCSAIANNLPYDFIFCVGDDRDDEDMFSTIHEIVNEAKSKDSENPIHCYCTTVGKKMSQANYWLDSSEKVRRLLLSLASGHPQFSFSGEFVPGR